MKYDLYERVWMEISTYCIPSTYVTQLHYKIQRKEIHNARK